MNPYLAEGIRLSGKAAEWGRRGKGKNPYIREALEVRSKSLEWDVARKHEFKLFNNKPFRDYYLVIDGVELLLRPRVKLIYDLISGIYVDPRELASLIHLRFALPEASPKPVYIDLDDVRKESSGMTIYFRDFSLLDAELDYDNTNETYLGPIDAARQFLISQEIANLSINYNNIVQLVYKARLPIEEDADEMIARFLAAHPGYMNHKRPLMVVSNLLSERWFSPSRALKFFTTFGKIRFLKVVKRREVYVASVEYHTHSDFVKAMKILTGCSVGQSRHPELQDYEISLSLNEDQSA